MRRKTRKDSSLNAPLVLVPTPELDEQPRDNPDDKKV